MRKLNTEHWSNLSDLEGLLFFSQSIDEMLFDFTLDSYKPSALNSRLLCIECLTQIDEVKNGFINEKNIHCIIEELKWSLNTDIAAKAILTSRLEFYIGKINSNQHNLDKLTTVISLILKQFSGRKYFNKVKGLLKTYVENGKNKSKCRSLINSFLTELINLGYHPNQISYQNNNFFFNPHKREIIQSPKDINDFFSLFNFEESKFTIVFIGGIVFRNFKDTLNNYDIVVTKNYNCFSKIPDDLAFKESIKRNESFIISSNVEAFDHYSARESAEKFLGQVTGLFNFYHHKQKAELLYKAVVSRTQDNYVIVIDRPTRSILNIKNEQTPKEAALSVQETISNLKLSAESLARFARSIDLHSAALSASTLENQLLDLWAAIETLMPKDYDSNQDRIVQLSEALIPFLQLNYIQKQLLELLNDLKYWNEQKFNECLIKVPNFESYNEVEGIAALVALESNLNLRQELYSELSDFPLLKNRLCVLHENLKSPESIKKILDFHKQKAEWHIRRIYRTRGQIIHSGKYPTYTSILIENLHNYFDIFLKKIISLSKELKINTIEHGILEVQMHVEYQYALLKKHQGKQLDKDNFIEALLGKDTK